MTRFQVRLHGKNFKILIDGVQTSGFYATRCIDASDIEQAKEKAIALVLNEPIIKSSQHPIEDLPRLECEDVQKIHWFTSRLLPLKGYTFY